MQAGQLRERIAIQRNTPAGDGMGGETQSWSTVATVWGRVRMMQGTEQYSAASERVQGAITHKVNLRQKAGGVTLNHEDRFLWQGRTLEIVSFGDMEGRHREQVIMCREVL